MCENKYLWVQRVSGLKPEAHHSSKHVRCGAAEKQSIEILIKTGILVCGASSKLSTETENHLDTTIIALTGLFMRYWQFRLIL
jgi:hypothetical protein